MAIITPASVAWLFPIFTPLMIVLFAFRNELGKKNVQKMFEGLSYGILIYGSLMLASYAHDPNNGLSFLTEYISTSTGATLYEALIGMIGAITLIEFIFRRVTSGFIVGIVVAFSIFEVYFAINCVETIPFMESILKHQ